MATGAECSWQRHLTGLLPLTALYLLLGFYQIDHQSLWTDEVISVNRASAQSLWARVNSQSSLYFVLLGLWTEVAGTTEWALRSLSALFGLAAVCLVYAIALKLFDRRTALVSAALLATSPYVIWYAQEARYVTLMLLTSLAMTYSFHRAVYGGGARWWLAYSVTSALALLTFVTIGLLIVAQGLYLLFQRDLRPLVRKWLVSQFAIGLFFAPWFITRMAHGLPAVLSERPRLVTHDQGRSRDKMPMTDLVGTLPYTFFAFSAGFSLGPSLKDLHESRSIKNLSSHAPLLAPLAILYASLFALGLGRLRRERGTQMFLLLWLGVPLLGVFTIATMTTYHVYNTRYVAMALPAYLFILATGIAGIRRPRMQLGLLAAVLLVHGVSLYNFYFDAQYGRPDARAAARYLESAAKPGEVILAVGNPRALNYYYQGEIPVIRVNGRSEEKWPAVARDLQEHVTRRDRVWLVKIRSWESDPREKIKPAMDELASHGESKHLPGIDIYAYERPVSREQGTEDRGQRAVSREQRAGSRGQ
jgi:uncharacterized membrane protein